MAQPVDQFQQMRTNMGEEMTRTNSYYGPFGYHGGETQAPPPLWFSRRFEPVYLPPLPPALGDELPYGRVAGATMLPAVDFSREIFYEPYARLVARNDATPKQTQRVAAYRNHRDALLREIEAKFDELRDATPAVRAAGLAELARQQDGRLQALAAEAESIRSDLSGGQESRNLLEALYEYPGLSTDQRLLLPEIAYGTAVRSNDQQASDGRGAYLYFLPATAKIALPAKLDPGLEVKIQAFVREKEALKSELRRAVVREDNYFAFRRAQRLAALAAEQAPRFAALENLAEEIRIGLAGYSWSEQPEPPALPAELAQRVTDFQQRKIELQRDFAGRLRRLRFEYPNVRFETALQGETLAIVQASGSPKPVPGVAEFNASRADRCVALTRESESLRRDIQHYAETHPNQVAGSVDQVATAFAKAYVARQTWSAYRDYFRAVLQPGLSPGQRRLLFQAVAERLDQAGWLPRR